MQRFLVPLFTFVWWNRLRAREPITEAFNYMEYTEKEKNTLGIIKCTHVIKVKGLRTALVDTPGRGRQTITFLFSWEKI